MISAAIRVPRQTSRRCRRCYDIYAETGMLPKMDVAQFKHPTIVAPLQ